jgi:glycosyltransferase involved in cell wall biosynthesis
VHPQLLTIHDVSYERRPEWNAYKNDRFRRAFYRRGALAADRIVTDSEFSRSEITAAYAIPRERIAVVPLAAADAFVPGPFDPQRQPHVRQPYVLHVGDLQIRRNVATALDAVLQLRRLPHPVTLVCAGVDRGEAAGLAARARTAADPDAIVFTGAVDDQALLNLYRGAAALVYPSRYEGFGIPILEAMRCGIPVVAADTSSLPELVGSAGALLSPDDAEAWAAAILRILEEPATAADLAARSREQAATFTWRRTAEMTLDLLIRLAGGLR